MGPSALRRHDGSQALLVAATNGDIAAAKARLAAPLFYLFRCVPTPRRRDAASQEALGQAPVISNTLDSDGCAWIRCLLALGSRRFNDVSSAWYVGRNAALHVAALNKHAAMVLFLIAELADVTKANKTGCVTERTAEASNASNHAIVCAQ